VVDDDSALTQVLKKLLASLGHTVTVAHNGREALDVILRFRPDLVITDWAMPEMDGIQLVRALRETKLGQALYILILTSFENDDRLVEAFESGVDDYIVKPFTPRVLQARLQSAIRSIKQKNTMSGDIEDMRKFASELAINNRRLQQAVLTDPLTGLPNRRYALDRLEQEWAATFRRQGSLSCIMVDVDHFKSVNDRFGHDVGDEVLRYVGNLLRTKARLQDAICRIGGEEFLVICPDTNEAEVFRAGERLRSIFAENTYVAGDFKLPVTLSMGVATAGVNCNNTSEFIKQADQAVYRAKANGRNCVSV
jgi:diguanylate cyclase (GGDEF)-like protein